nr:unnamed protein product [Digitaria exilis]
MWPSPMAARAAAGGCSSAGLALFGFRPLHRAVRPGAAFSWGQSSLHGGCRSRLAHSLVDSVLDELRSRRRLRVSAKIGLQGTKELSDNKIDKRALQKGLLLEFQKDSERSLLAVVERPDGKKNWMVTDQGYIMDSLVTSLSYLVQNGILSSIKPQQVTYVVPGVMNFDSSKIDEFLEKAQDLLVEELLRRKLAKEEAEKELEEFIHLLKSAKALPMESKPPKSSWLGDEKIKQKIEALQAYAVDACDDEQRRLAGNILKSMGFTRTSSAALKLLINIGYFPVHVNLDLFRYDVRIRYTDKVLSAAEELLVDRPDSDMHIRKDLSTLKVYAIDVDEADELDDALSATRLPDGRIKVWIHVADPTCLVKPRSIIDREAMHRGTSIFLPTATFPMFPERLAMDAMSLQQGKQCKSVSISVILHPDGSIAEYTVENSVIKPTYMLTYESASELLYMNLKEEEELRILQEAASIRAQWRRSQGSIDTAMIEPRIKVSNPDDPEPNINLYVEDQANPAMQLVSEMMILCGEAVAAFGADNNLALPYRGHPQSNTAVSAFSHLPEGPARSFANISVLRAAEMDFQKPITHGVLGIPGYVQFTSPIRRYVDLLAHYQVGMQVTTIVSRGKVGDEVSVVVETAHPRDDILSIREVIEDTDDAEE